MSFEADITAAYNKKVEGFQDKVVRKLTLDIQGDLDRQTPRDTGRAASNWLGSVGLPRATFVEQFNGSPPINFSGYRNGMSVFIANNLPYITRLNQGHSKQAPKRFVETAIQRHIANVPDIARVVRP